MPGRGGSSGGRTAQVVPLERMDWGRRFAHRFVVGYVVCVDRIDTILASISSLFAACLPPFPIDRWEGDA